MSGGNATLGGYRSNPYFDGVISAITTQGEVTANVRADRWEVEERRKNSSSVRQTGSYPGGEVWDNLHIMPHEMIFGWTNKKARFNFPGEPNEMGFSALNGIWYAGFDTDEEMMDNMYCIGLAKTPYKFDSLDQLKHGFAVIRVGSGSTFHTGTKPIYAGDQIGWSVVLRPQAVDPNLPAAFEGGEYGGNPDPRVGSAYNAGGRQGYPRYGTPRGKFRFILNPVVRGDVTPGMNGAICKMMKPMSRGGVSNMPVEALFTRRKNRNYKRPTPYQEYAKSTLVSDVIGAARVIELLFDEGLLFDAARVNATVDLVVAAAVAGGDEAAMRAPLAGGLPRTRRANVLNLVDQIGIFGETERLPPLLQKIIDSLYVGYSANASTSIRETGIMRQVFSGAFAQNGTLKNNLTTAVRYVTVIKAWANLRGGSYDKAVYHKTRRTCGTALGPSTKGQRLDILLGHNLH